MQNGELSIQNSEISAHDAKFRSVVLGGSGRRDLFMPMALWQFL